MRRVDPFSLAWLLTGLLLAGAVAQAAAPTVGQIVPVGGQRGTELEVTFQGARLADLQQVLFYEPGIEVLGITPVEKNANAVKTKLKIAADCRLGAHKFRLRTATGISNLRTFSVGAFPQVDEKEPNSDFAQPQAVALGTCVQGVCENEDVDYYSFEAKQGQRINAEVEALRLGNESFDPAVAILDAERFVVASADDTPLCRLDSVASVVAPKDGVYVIEVRESSYRGNGNSRYRLHLGSYPRPRAVYPAGGKAGTELEVRWLGDVAGERAEKVKLPDAPRDDFTLFAQDDKGISPWPYEFRVSSFDNALETEPNNTPAEASAAGDVPRALNGILDKEGDIDCFKIAAKKGQALDVRVLARTLRSPIDSVLSIRKLDGGALANNDDSGSPDSYLRFTAPEDGEYVIQVQDQLGQGGPEYVYRVEVAPVEPRLVINLPERKQFDDTIAAVPQGNRLALMVAAQRQDFGGELAVELKDLPAGIAVETVPLRDGQAETPVLLTAAADAPVAGALVDVIGRPTADSPKIEGRLRQRTSLIRGNNNVEIWNQYADRMAVAVTQAVPFTLEIVQPKAPLVQNGSKEIKVLVKRNGFDGPITLQTLYNPPGVSTTNSVQVAQGASEAVVPLTANGGAAVGAWKFAILGTADSGDGPVTASTQLADLEIAAPFFKFTYTPAAVERGQATQLAVAIEQVTPFEGNAQVTLVGLPAQVTTEPREINKDATQLSFPLATTAESPVGHHKTLVCQAVVTVNGEPVNHVLGGGELRINPPPPAPKTEAPKAAEAPKPAAPQPPQEKPLSRLEQLRQQREQKK